MKQKVHKAIINQLQLDAFNFWSTLDIIDKKRQSGYYPYTVNEIRYVLNNSQKICEQLKDAKLNNKAKKLKTESDYLWNESYAGNDTKIMLSVNKIKDIIHKIHDGDFADKINPVETTIDSFPRYRNNTKKDQYMLVYESRILWLSNLLYKKLGKEYSDALDTTYHDFAEYTGHGSHTAYDILQRIDNAVEKKVITKEERLKILKKIIELLTTYYFQPSIKSEKRASKIEKELSKLRKKLKGIEK